MKARSDAEIYEILQNMGLYVELRCGKWFLNDVEYNLNGKGGLRHTLLKCCASNIPELGSVAIMDRLLKYIQITLNDPQGKWPEMPMLVKARSLMESGYTVDKNNLAYPLNNKELKLINFFLCRKDPYLVFFYGVGGSGKSTVANIIENMFGVEDTCHCAFSALGEAFQREGMAGKRFWRDDDINPNWTGSQAGTLKKIVTHALDQFNPKSEKVYTAEYRCKGLLCCNVPPKFDVSDSGLLRRILYYSKNKKIENPILGMDTKVYTEQELLDIAVAALSMDMTDWFKDFEQETHEIIMNSNSVYRYGMCSHYEFYVENCAKAGVHAFGEDKWVTIKELFESWGVKNGEETTFN